MATTPYIGSKISLISNSEIRYEGVLYTINSQESTIALQSVRCLGTEGRKQPEIPPSNEIYDFIIFRGQDIKDLTVLEQAASPMDDPAIMSVNSRPPTSQGDKGGKGGGGGNGGGGGKGWGEKGDKGKGGGKAPSKGGSSWEQNGKGKADGKGKGGKGKDGGKGQEAEKGHSGKGGDAKGKGKGGDSKGKGGKDAGKGGKDSGKGGKDSSKGSKGGGDKDKGKGGGGGGGGGKGKGGGGGKADNANSNPGELVPQEGAKKITPGEDFDVASSNAKFDKVTSSEGGSVPLTGYNKSSSFFDNISCQATERSGQAERQKVDRDKARQSDREAFGGDNRPKAPNGEHRYKGARRGRGGSGTRGH